MNFFNRKAISKLIVKALVISSMAGIGAGYNLLSTQPICVSALESSDTSSVSASTKTVSIKSAESKGEYTVYMKSDGTVWGIGYNADGELGIGNTTNQTSPVKVPISDVKEIVSGGDHTFFIKNDGTVWGCGCNSSGQLGIGNTTNQISPVQINISNVKEIICGGSYTIFKKNDGTVWGCGLNSVGQLGIGNTTNQTSIVKLSITDVDEVVCAGGARTFFKKNDGTLWACGANEYGQLGIGNTTSKTTIVQVPIIGVDKIGYGIYHTIFLKSDGTLWGCGLNDVGQLGMGNTTNQISLTQIHISDVSEIGCGYNHTIFKKNDGTVWGCGYNAFGELGIGNTTNQISPVQIPISDVSEIVCCYYHTILKKNDGTFWGCGKNTSGQLGIGNTNNQISPINLTNYWLTKTDSSYESITLNKSSIDVQTGISEQLIVTTTPAGLGVTWKSSDESIATVDNNGRVTAIKTGKATITVSTTDGSNLSVSCVVNVTTTSPKVVVNIEPEKSSIHLNETVAANLTIDNIKEIAAEDIRIKYDNTKLKFLSMDEVDGIKLVKSEGKDGELRLILASKGLANVIQAKKALLKLNFQGIAKGEALVDITKGRVSDGIEMEKDLTDEECGQGTIIIDDEVFKDVNNSGEFTLLDLAIDARHLGEDPKTLSEYNTDQVLNGAIDDDDLTQIGKYMLENGNYQGNK